MSLGARVKRSINPCGYHIFVYDRTIPLSQRRMCRGGVSYDNNKRNELIDKLNNNSVDVFDLVQKITKTKIDNFDAFKKMDPSIGKRIIRAGRSEEGMNALKRVDDVMEKEREKEKENGRKNTKKIMTADDILNDI